MSSTYLATVGDATAARLCVIKLGTTDRERDQDNADRLLQEARVTMRLSCASIATVLDAGRIDTIPYIATEFVDGRDLSEMMAVTSGRGDSFPVPIALYVGREITRALHHAFSESGLGLIHRDVAPANVVVSYSGDVKLIDFGIARLPGSARATMAGNIVGHVGYLSPERLRGQKGDDRSDLYAAGVIVWEMLTGKTLFPARRDGREKLATTSVEVPRPSSRRSGIPPELDAVVLRALAPRANDRYRDAGEFWTGLADALVRAAPMTDSRTIAAYLKNLVGEDLVQREKADHERYLSAHLDTLGEKGAARPKHSWLGMMIDKYRIERLLGRGAMGDVYEAEHVGIGRRVAIKILQSEWRSQPAVVERFEREARLAATADHENVVEILDAGTAINGSRYIVMEYLDGETVEARITRSGPLSVADSVAIALDVARALEKAHRAGIIHRDLKPANVMIWPREDGKFRIKVLDFGISKAIKKPVEKTEFDRELTGLSEALGTPEYMPPEQIRGRAADERSDVYAMGCMLYEMLTGRRLWNLDETDREGALKLVLFKAVQDPDLAAGLGAKIPAVVAQTVAKAVSRDPADRQQSMTELREALQSFVADREPVREAGSERPETGSRGVRPAGAADPAGPAKQTALRPPAGQENDDHLIKSASAPASRPWKGPAAGLLAAGIAIVVGATGIRAMRHKAVPPAAPVARIAASASGERRAPPVPPPPPEPRTTVGTSAPAEREADMEHEMTPTTHPTKGQGRSTPTTTHAAPRAHAPAQSALVDRTAGPPASELLASARRAANLGKYEVALEDARRAASVAVSAQDRATAHIITGDVLDVMTNYTGATREYETALSIDPGNHQAASRLALVQKAHAQ